MFDLPRPECLDDSEWTSLASLVARLHRADTAGDQALVLGCAKELCEATARIVWRRRGEQFGSRTDMSELVREAQRLVDRLPVPGSSASDPVRDLSQAAMKLVGGVVVARNRAGSGHGRAEVVPLDSYDAALAAGTAYLWCAWVLSRLDQLVASQPETIADDLRAKVFTRGELAARLRDAGLGTMSAEDQRMIGVAVGQRSSAGTFVVREDAIDPAADSASLTEWSPDYRAGVVEGVFLDRDGYAAIPAYLIDVTLRVLAPLPDLGARVLQRLQERLRQAELNPSLSDDRGGIVERVRYHASRHSDVTVAALLESLADIIAAL